MKLDMFKGHLELVALASLRSGPRHGYAMIKELRERSGVAPDEAERQAVERFGAAAVVARRFAHAVASTSTRTALAWVTTAFATYAIAAIVFIVAAPSWLLDFPQGAPSMTALQIAFVAL